MLPMTMNYDQAAERCRMDFTSAPQYVSLVRRQIARAIGSWGCAPEDVDRAVLICSELATNAVQHGHRAGSRFSVAVVIDRSGCLIEVSDSGTGVPRPAVAQTEDEHGRGLALVKALADDVGHRLNRPCGKTIWARFTLASDRCRDLRYAKRGAGR